MSAMPAVASVAGVERPTYDFQGREVTLPVFVRQARSAAVTYVVSSDAARNLLPGDGLEIAEVMPGRTLFSISSVDYIDNDLGDYNEVSLAFFVRERGTPAGFPYTGAAYDFVRNRLATYIHRLPVTQSFTREAGEGIWGFPKTVEEIDINVGDESCRTTLSCDGRHVLTLDVPAGGTRRIPDAAMTTYSYIGGRLHRTRFLTGAEQCGFQLAGSTLTLGDHPIADELRALGLPRRPLLSAWLGRMSGRFVAPEPV